MPKQQKYILKTGDDMLGEGSPEETQKTAHKLKRMVGRAFARKNPKGNYGGSDGTHTDPRWTRQSAKSFRTTPDLRDQADRESRGSPSVRQLNKLHTQAKRLDPHQGDDPNWYKFKKYRGEQKDNSDPNKALIEGLADAALAVGHVIEPVVDAVGNTLQKGGSKIAPSVIKDPDKEYIEKPKMTPKDTPEESEDSDKTEERLAEAEVNFQIKRSTSGIRRTGEIKPDPKKLLNPKHFQAWAQHMRDMSARKAPAHVSYRIWKQKQQTEGRISPFYKEPAKDARWWSKLARNNKSYKVQSAADHDFTAHSHRKAALHHMTAADAATGNTQKRHISAALAHLDRRNKYTKESIDPAKKTSYKAALKGARLYHADAKQNKDPLVRSMNHQDAGHSHLRASKLSKGITQTRHLNAMWAHFDRSSRAQKKLASEAVESPDSVNTLGRIGALKSRLVRKHGLAKIPITDKDHERSKKVHSQLQRADPDHEERIHAGHFRRSSEGSASPREMNRMHYFAKILDKKFTLKKQIKDLDKQKKHKFGNDPRVYNYAHRQDE